MDLIKWLNQNDHTRAYTYVLITLVTCLLATVWYAKQPGVDLIPDNMPILGEVKI